MFDGQLGYLDTALANETLFDRVTGTTIFHINADEPDILDYDTSFKSNSQAALYEPLPYRVSDQDPVIVGLSFGSTGRNARGRYISRRKTRSGSRPRSDDPRSLPGGGEVTPVDLR